MSENEWDSHTTKVGWEIVDSSQRKPLVPCPFCGKATAHALIAKEQMPGYRAWKLSVRGECTNQGCRTLGPQYSLIVPQDIDPPYKTEEWHAVIDQAIAAWNQRSMDAELQRLQDRVHWLEGQNKRLQEILDGWQVETYGDY